MAAGTQRRVLMPKGQKGGGAAKVPHIPSLGPKVKAKRRKRK